MTRPETLEPAKRRRLITFGLLRSLVTAAVLVALYYLLPLDHINNAPSGALLSVGLAILLAVSVWQIHAIVSAKYPAVRAIEALASTVPLFLLLFASVYYLMARTNPASFNVHLTRTDALYFTVTVFSSVGFGDIATVSQSARLLVTVQMILDLLIVGLGIRAFIGAVKRGYEHGQPDSADPDSPPEPP